MRMAGVKPPSRAIAPVLFRACWGYFFSSHSAFRGAGGFRRTRRSRRLSSSGVLRILNLRTLNNLASTQGRKTCTRRIYRKSFTAGTPPPDADTSWLSSLRMTPDKPPVAGRWNCAVALGSSWFRQTVRGTFGLTVAVEDSALSVHACVHPAFVVESKPL